MSKADLQILEILENSKRVADRVDASLVEMNQLTKEMRASNLENAFHRGHTEEKIKVLEAKVEMIEAWRPIVERAKKDQAKADKVSEADDKDSRSLKLGFKAKVVGYGALICFAFCSETAKAVYTLFMTWAKS